MSHDTQTHSGSDAKAAFLGLFIGVIVLFGIVRTIVYLTNAHYTGEKSHVEATK